MSNGEFIIIQLGFFNSHVRGADASDCGTFSGEQTICARIAGDCLHPALPGTDGPAAAHAQHVHMRRNMLVCHVQKKKTKQKNNSDLNRQLRNNFIVGRPFKDH